MKENYSRLGDYIREVDVRNRDLTVTTLLGLSVSKTFIPSIANTIGTDMSTYKIVEKDQFVYIADTSRRGDKIAIALLKDFDDAIVSQAYTVFEIIDHNKLLPDYLMMWFRRPEFDRYARYHSHGSAREIFDWSEMCDVQLPIPPIDRQREIVSEYETLSNRIRLNKQLIAKLEDTAQTLYRQTFVDNIDPNNLPDGWHIKAMGELCKIITGKKDVHESCSIGKYRFFSCSPDIFYSNEYIASGPAILIAGNGSYTGRVTYYDKKFDLYQRTYACIPNEEYSSLAPFLYCVFKFSFEPQVTSKTRGSSIPYIVRGDISDFNIVYHSKHCSAFSEKITILINYQTHITNENAKLTSLHSLLLSKMG